MIPMQVVQLALKEEPRVPLEAEALLPETCLALDEDGIRGLTVYHGNKRRTVGDFFSVDGCRSERLELVGDLSKLKRIGWGMKRGSIRIRGSTGMHLGALMSGGSILVEGNAGDWLGAQMSGGTIRVKGNAGNFAGAAYRGEKRGMTGGTILIEGSAGHMAGELMRRGMIAIGKDSGDFPGGSMLAGTVVIFGRPGERPGGGMKRGTVLCLEEATVLPTFRYNCTFNPIVARILLSYLKAEGFPVREEHLSGSYRRYSGDISELGKGEILIWNHPT